VSDHTGEVTALTPGQFVPQLLSPHCAIGHITGRAMQADPRSPQSSQASTNSGA